MNKFLISVLLPIGGDKRYLKEAIESINKQSYKNIELLAAEDEGSGITGTLTKLAERAKGEFLARMDADDISEPNRLERQINYLNTHPDVMLVGSRATLIDESGKKMGLQKMPTTWDKIKKEVFFSNPLIHPSWMMRRKWYERVGGYDLKYKYSQDWELLLRRVWKDRIENIPEPLIRLRIHKNSSSFFHNKEQVWFGIKARFEAIQRGDISFWKVIFLLPNIVSLIIPAKLKYLCRSTRLPRPEARLAMTGEKGQSSEDSPYKDCLHGRGKVLGIVLPMGQSRKLLIKSGQWGLWESEINEYKKHFDKVEVFEYKYFDWRRFMEVFYLGFGERFRGCDVLKAVHLTGAIPCLLSKLFWRKKYVLSYGYRYDEFARLDRKWFQWILFKLLAPMTIKLADAVMVPTDKLKRYVEEYGAKRVKVIPNGVDTRRFAPNLKFKIKNLKFQTIIFVGRLEKQKNLEALIKAMEGFKAQLLFIGSGSLKHELQNLAKSLGVDLSIIEKIDNNKLPEYYQSANIFVLPSLIEGHPKVLLEAMACGLPCVVSDIAGCTEIITDGKNGLLVKPTVNGIVSGLNRLVGDEDLRRRLGKEAGETVEKFYDKKKLMNNEIKLLQSL